MSQAPNPSDRVFENKLDRSSQQRLARSFQNCRMVSKRVSTTVYPGVRRIAEPKRSALLSLYAWKRRVDDAADTDGLVESRRIEIDRLRAMTVSAFDGTPPRNADAFWDAFTDTVHRYRIPWDWIDSVFDGVTWDLECGVCQTEADLEQYCYRVASTMGMCFVRVCGVNGSTPEAEALELAKTRSLGFQLTNILRDFAEDYDQYPKRIYIPLDSFVQAGLKPNAMRVWMPAEASERFAQQWIESTKKVFDASDGLEEMLSSDCRSGIRLMTQLARETLSELARNPSRMVRGKKAEPGRLKHRALLVGGFLSSR